MDVGDSSQEDNVDRWYAPYAPPVNRSEFVANLDNVGALLLETQPGKLIGHDERIRRRWLTEPRDLHGLFSVRAEDVADIVSEASNATAAAGVLSMHPSGYVREAAVAMLGHDESPRALRFLLVRCADWVPEIRREAEERVTSCFDERHVGELLACLGLVGRLSSTERGATIAHQALDSIAQFSTIDALIEALRSDDLVARRSAARLLVEDDRALDALAWAMRQGDPKTLQIVAEGALQRATGAQREALLRRLVSTRSSSLAELAMWTLLREASDSDALARGALLDRRRGIRLLGRDHLQGTGFDAAAFYRELLLRDPVLGLRGLGDVGTKDDAALAASSLKSGDPAVRRAAVDAVARLDGAAHSSALMERLTDDAVGVAATAGRSLARIGMSATSTEQLWHTMSSDDRQHVTRACARAARGLPRWSRTRIALRSIATADPQLRDIGLDMIDQILFTWNRSYLAPTFEEAQELSTLLDSTCAVLGPHRCNDLAFAMAAYGVETVTATEMSAEMADVVLPQPRGALKRLREAWRRRQ